MAVLRARLASRVAGFTESVIREMSRLAARHGAVNLGQGFPDFPAPQALKDAACAAIQADLNQYAITWGAADLRQAVAAKAMAFNRLPEVDPERHVTVTCGATEAMMATMLATIEPGDEVIVFEPFYENYGPDAILAQAELKVVPMDGPGFAFDPERLKAAFGPRTKAIVVNTPHNPTGKVFGPEELALIAELCQRHDALAFTDEIYEHMVYDGLEHRSIGSLPGMAERTVTISGLSKTFAVTGWRLGTIVAPADLTAAIRKAHDFLTVGAPAPLQAAAAQALAFGPDYYEALQRSYLAKREAMLSILRQARLPFVVPQGAYYVMCDVSEFGLDSEAFVRRLIEEVGVAAVPGTAFTRKDAEGLSVGRRWVRFAFPKKPETLEEAGRRLARVPEAFGGAGR